ncbi:hypothetical protein SAMN02910358_00081 [Lachnospiraceae bacterium XBB1006]|nr:hypothetical protein SAMN02910358_00081 [Lachnospiraceae bacterium XBB1006]
MSKKKYIFVDLDGTLLTDEKTVCQRNQLAIEKAMYQGHHVITTTGRPLESAIIGAKNAGLQRPGCYILSYNGGLIYECASQRTLYEETLSMKCVENMFKKAREVGIHIQAYCQGKVWCEQDSEEVRHYHANGKMPYEVHRDVPKELTENTRKLIAISFDHEKLKEFQMETRTVWEKDADTLFSTPFYLEILPKGVSKGNGIRRMAKILSFDMEQTIAIGDEENDISMIEAAHLGVAMSNAIAKAKEAANYVTKADNNAGGVAEVIEQFVLD